MHLNKDFKLVNKNKWIMISVLGTIFLASIVLLVVTSWYKYDLAISHFFYRAEDYKFFRGWTAYTVLDGYNLIITYSVPTGLMMLDSIYVYYKNKKTKLSNNSKRQFIRWTYIVILIGYVLAIGFVLPVYCFGDFGFGKGFVYWFTIGWDFLIPIYVVSFLANISICFGLCWYVHYRLAKRDDFLTGQFWKKGLSAAFFLALLYIMMGILKGVMGRPYLYNIEWDKYLAKIKYAGYEKQYEIYIHQNKFNHGWAEAGWQKGGKPDKDGNLIYNNALGFEPQDLEWPWWKMGKGIFAKHTSIWESLPNETAFPSGHVDEVVIGLSMVMAIFSRPENKRQKQLRTMFFWFGIIWLLNMFFSLEISLNHWTSDMAFSLATAPVMYLLGIELANWSSDLFIYIRKKYLINKNQK